MSSSSEQLQATPYLPMEYREAGDSSETTLPAEASVEPAAPEAEDSAPQSDPAELFATRLEEERRTITAQLRQEAEEEIRRARSEIARAIESFAKQREEYFRQAETEVVSLSLAIARRIIHRESQMDPRLIAGLVNYELEQLDVATSTRLFVSPGTLGAWNEALPTLAGAVELMPDKALAPGDVRIETALGVTSVSFERELKEIERGFFDLLSRRPAASESKSVRVQ
jgi:flagellar assembly protein FliH